MPGKSWEDEDPYDPLDDNEYPGEDDGEPASDTQPCPACGAEVYEDAPRCPRCGEYVTPGSSPPSLWVLLIVLGIPAAIVALVVYAMW